MYWYFLILADNYKWKIGILHYLHNDPARARQGPMHKYLNFKFSFVYMVEVVVKQIGLVLQTPSLL